MFGRQETPLIDRIRRAADLVRAFALLEDVGDRQPMNPPAPGTAHTVEPTIPHPHSARLARAPRDRRPGSTAPRPAHCLTPVNPIATGPLRRELALPRRSQSRRAGPHHRS